ncbi:hypothetical protein BGZ58_000801 [Dissophora ornata]|nr:hypothetical protein BGZ58_000801 [Dissophora ornata]
MTTVASPAMIASGSFSNNNKAKPVSVATAVSPFAIDIRASARASALAALEKRTPPQAPPQLSSSVVSSDSYDSLDEEEAVRSVRPFSVGPVAARGGCEACSRRQSQQFFFPNQSRFESAVPQVVRARDIHLKDHPIVEGAFAEYEALYNADSLVTKDGVHMVRLL